MMEQHEHRLERFRRLEQLYQRAQELPAAERQTLLDQECADDEALRREVATLLAVQPQAAALLAVPAPERAARRRVAQLAQQKPPEQQPVAQPAALLGRAINQYEIVAPLGKGGMGEVWLAEDRRLKRKVALKLLPAEFTHDADRVRRFEQEAHAVSALNHPHIVTLFDFGHTDDAYFITTEFVDGQTLRARLQADTRLPAREASGIVLQICAALAAAHDAGIIHRDIKPENVMLRRDGYVKVLDFGLARITNTATPAADSQAATLVKHSTVLGVVLGTASYMSPEQARGQKVDARSDIFSLGIVLYEMLTGRLPFEGETASDRLAAILKSEPLPLPDALPELAQELTHEASAALQLVITRALVKEREARYQTIQALAGDLKQCAETLQFQARLARSGEAVQPAVKPLPDAEAQPRPARRQLFVSGTLALLALLTALAWWMLKSKPATPAVNAPIKTLAVLPFRFLGGERAEEYLGQGMTETLITKLGSARQLTVRPTSAVLKYQTAAVEPERAARELKTDAVIDGSVQKAGDKLRVSVQLIRAGEAQPFWAGDFKESVNDLFILQDKLAARVTQELLLSLTGAEQRQLAKRLTNNVEAWQLYQQGRFFHDKRPTEGIQQARGFYERALARAPNFAMAQAALALTWSDLVERESVPLAEGAQQALTLAARAVQLDDRLADAHAYLGHMKLSYAWDLPGAGAEFQHAVELDPQQMATRQFNAVYLLAVGRAEEAIAESRRAVALDPVSLPARSQLGRALYLGRRYDEVIAACQELRQMDENFVQTYVWLGQTYTQQGNHAAAIATLEKANRLASGRSETLGALGHAYAAAGRMAEARQRIVELQGHHDLLGKAYHLATVYAGLGERAMALAQLEETYRQRNPMLLVRSKLDPKLDPLRNEPGFKALLQRLGLAQDKPL